MVDNVHVLWYRESPANALSAINTYALLKRKRKSNIDCYMGHIDLTYIRDPAS